MSKPEANATNLPSHNASPANSNFQPDVIVRVNKTGTYYVNSKESVLLQTATIFVSTDKVRLIFDSGSQRSYVTERLRSKVNLTTVGQDTLLINSFGSDKTGQKPETCDVVQVQLRDVKGLRTSTNLQAFVVPTICPPLESQCTEKAAQQFDGIMMADEQTRDSDVQIDLLIGADNLWKFFTGAVKRGKDNSSLVASETILGWVLSGPVLESRPTTLSSVNFVSTHVLKVAAKTEDQEVLKSPEPDVDRLWDLESIGIKEKETVLDTFEKNVTYDDNRYCVTLPLKDKHQTLPDNYELSLARLRNLTKRLYKTPNVLKEYNKIFTEQLQNGIIEKVDREQEPFPGQVHYLPHQAVIREDAVTTKLRVVFDASAKVKPSSPSLNECTYTGPSLISQIFEILTRFGSHKIGLVSDIEKAFLNIAVTKEQRDLMRFLWIDDVTKPDPTVEVYRFCRVIFGMNCSPFLLNATLKLPYFKVLLLRSRNSTEGTIIIVCRRLVLRRRKRR